MLQGGDRTFELGMLTVVVEVISSVTACSMADALQEAVPSLQICHLCHTSNPSKCFNKV